MVLRLATFAAALLLSPFLLAACSDKEDEGRERPFGSPRGISLSPARDELVVADAGTGNGDGRVLVLALSSAAMAEGPLEPEGERTVFEGLPSRRVEGRGYTSIAGPAAAAMAEDGVVCVVIAADGDRQGGELRCTDGLEVDLSAFEAERNPDGGEIASDPAGIAADATRGWFVADAAANTVLFVDRSGAITVVAIFDGSGGLGTDARPTGLYSIEGRVGPLVAVALYGGALAGFSPAVAQPPIVQVIEGLPVAILDDATETLALLRSNAAGDDGSGSVYNLTSGATLVAELDRPSGFAALPGGLFIVSFEDAGTIEVFRAE